MPVDLGLSVTPTAPDPTAPLYTTWLLYGAGGTGKTTLADTFPGPILYLDWDWKLYHLPPREDRHAIQYSTPENPRDVKAEWARFRKDLYKICTAPELPYNTIVLDSLSACTVALQMAVLQQAGKDPFLADDSKLTIGEHGDIAAQLDTIFAFIRRCRNAHFVCCAHEAPVEDQKNKLFGFYPICPGAKIKHKLSEIFAETYHLKVAQGKFILEWNAKPLYETCSRLLPRTGSGDHIVSPTYDKIISRSTSGKGRA